MQIIHKNDDVIISNMQNTLFDEEMKVKFNQHNNYGITCYGIGDIYCSINALENMAIERNTILNLYVLDANYQSRFKNIYDSLDVSHLNVKYEKDTEDHIEYFSAFGMFSSWVLDWLRGWGNKIKIGQECLIKYKDVVVQIPNKIGICFTVVSHSQKAPSKPSIIDIIDDAISRGNVHYYGYRSDTDKWIYETYKDKITFSPYELKDTIQSIRECSEFIGADSGMAWISAFGRVKTRIVVGRGFGEHLPKTFEGMDWVTREWEKTSLENDVTLICIDCIDTQRAINVIDKCKLKINFKNIKLLTSLDTTYEHAIKIDKISSREQYSEFCLLRLADFVETKFCLVIQYDGYIINSESWNNEWFNYDYIGAPFSYNDQVVGNGGFSLRSKKLLDLCKRLYIEDKTSHGHHEDYAICWHWRKKIIECGCIFASLDVAKNFSSEKENEIEKQFGFHNNKYAVRLDACDNKEILIQSITYGTEINNIDVTKELADEFVNCGFIINNINEKIDKKCGDPIYGVPKKLFINFLCNDRNMSCTIERGSIKNLNKVESNINILIYYTIYRGSEIANLFKILKYYDANCQYNFTIILNCLIDIDVSQFKTIKIEKHINPDTGHLFLWNYKKFIKDLFKSNKIYDYDLYIISEDDHLFSIDNINYILMNAPTYEKYGYYPGLLRYGVIDNKKYLIDLNKIHCYEHEGIKNIIEVANSLVAQVNNDHQGCFVVKPEHLLKHMDFFDIAPTPSYRGMLVESATSSWFQHCYKKIIPLKYFDNSLLSYIDGNKYFIYLNKTLPFINLDHISPFVEEIKLQIENKSNFKF